MKTILLCSFSYFALVFLAGFVLGFIRVLLLVPEIGERYAELLEMPLMLLAIYLSAKLIVIRFATLQRDSAYLVVGVLALLLLLVIEFTLVMELREISLAEYIASRDPISGTTYVVSLFIYMLMPFLIAKKFLRNP